MIALITAIAYADILGDKHNATAFVAFVTIAKCCGLMAGTAANSFRFVTAANAIGATTAADQILTVFAVTEVSAATMSCACCPSYHLHLNSSRSFAVTVVIVTSN